MSSLLHDVIQLPLWVRCAPIRFVSCGSSLQGGRTQSGRIGWLNRSMPQSLRKRVVITGMGVVSPNGIGVESFAQALAAGRSGIGPLQGIEMTQLRSSVAAQVRGFDPWATMDAAEVK